MTSFITSSTIPPDLIPNVTTYVRAYMSHFDSSHDFAHLKRVLGLAHSILSSLSSPESPHYDPAVPAYDKILVTLGALLHDVGDRKYLKAGEDPETIVREILLGFGTSSQLAEKVQTLCTNVSWTNEMKDPAAVQVLIDGPYPELAIVQDADRLDALGAVGVGRVFTYGAARTKRGMRESVQVFEGKLYKFEGRMKTSVGREMARIKTERLRDFQDQWDEELQVEGRGMEVLRAAGVGSDIVAHEEAGGFEEAVSMEEVRRRWREELRQELRSEVRKELMAEMLPN